MRNRGLIDNGLLSLSVDGPHGAIQFRMPETKIPVSRFQHQIRTVNLGVHGEQSNGSVITHRCHLRLIPVKPLATRANGLHVVNDIVHRLRIEDPFHAFGHQRFASGLNQLQSARAGCLVFPLRRSPVPAKWSSLGRAIPGGSVPNVTRRHNSGTCLRQRDSGPGLPSAWLDVNDP